MMRNSLDWIALSYIRRRLSDFKKRGDYADKFADRLVALLSAEIERRNFLYATWNAENKREAAEMARRRAVVERFESFGSGDQTRLQ